MIVSHAHRFIFFAVPKTATHSIRQVLRDHKGADDWEQQMLFGEQVLPISSIADIGHGHVSYQEIAPVLSSDQLKYFKLAFVRNPFDRFVSACAFLNRGNSQFSERATEWMKVALTRSQFRQRVLIRPQAHQLCNANGELAMDFIGRYETLQLSLDALMKKLGLPCVKLEVRNASEHSHYRDYLDSDLTEQLSEFYTQDLSLFDYQF